MPAVLKVMSEQGGSDEVSIERNPSNAICIQPWSAGMGRKESVSCAA